MTPIKLRAKIVPYSSIVGSGVILLSHDGPAVAQLAIINHGSIAMSREDAERLAQLIADRLDGQTLTVTS